MQLGFIEPSSHSSHMAKGVQGGGPVREATSAQPQPMHMNHTCALTVSLLRYMDSNQGWWH